MYTDNIQLKEMFYHLQDSLQVLRIRFDGTPELAMLHDKATEIVNVISSTENNLSTTSKQPKTSPPLHRPHFSAKRKTVENSSESNSEDDNNTTKGKSRVNYFDQTFTTNNKSYD